MYIDRANARPEPRLIAATLAAILQVGLALVVWFGFSPRIVRTGIQSALISLDLREPPPPPPPAPPPHHKPSHAASGRAAPPHLRAHATPVVAPRIIPFNPPPIPVATLAATGADNAAGAAAVAGPGSGAGGQGNGTGAGGTGAGEGSGGRDVELVGGRMGDSDIPAALRNSPFSGTTRAVVDVSAQGRVTACRTIRSSGNSQLDDITCRLIFQRFRFKPALDDQGRATTAQIIYDHDWVITGVFQAPAE